MKLTPPQFGQVLGSLKALGASGGSEHRVCTRMSVQAQVQLATFVGGKLGCCFTGISRDISIGGIGLLQHLPVKSGDEFIVCLPCEKQPLLITSRIVFARALADGIVLIGAEFKAMAEVSLVEQYWTARRPAA